MKVQYDFASFLCNGSNKEMLFDLIQQSIEESKSILKDRTVYFSNKRECTMIAESQATVVPELTSNHEEADTKLVALVCAASVSQGDSVLIAPHLVTLTSSRYSLLIILEIRKYI